MANLVARRNRDLVPWNDLFNIDCFFDSSWPGKWDRSLPAVNISEDDKNYMVDVVAPGFNKDDFKLKVDDDILTISAENKTEKTDGRNKEYSRREYTYSSFTRSFHLPDNVKDDAIHAHYDNGILKLELPKTGAPMKTTKEIKID